MKTSRHSKPALDDADWVIGEDILYTHASPSDTCTGVGERESGLSYPVIDSFGVQVTRPPCTGMTHPLLSA